MYTSIVLFEVQNKRKIVDMTMLFNNDASRLGLAKRFVVWPLGDKKLPDASR